MKIHSCIQGTAEWLQLRLGVVTASEADALISPTGEIRKGSGVATYLTKKLAEKWLGRPLASFGSKAMDNGSIREHEAIPWYEFTYGETVKRVGFITTDDGRLGCSPDGYGIEVKCPNPDTHVGYVLEGCVPKDYIAQVQTSMLVTGERMWRFLSYCRGFPALLIGVPRDEQYLEAMNEAIEKFNHRFDLAWNRMVELNGGPPPPPSDIEVRTMPGLDPETLEPMETEAARAAYLEFLKG